MTTTELLTHLRKLNITLSEDNGQLILRGPKGALMADLRVELKARKAEILDFLKSTANGQTRVDSSLRCVSRDKDLPLSFAQQRLWFLDQLEPGSTVYNVPGALRIEGPLRAEVLERCFNEIVRRHEALRTTFSAVEEEPVQVIAASTNIPLPVIDISRFSETEREEEARRLALEEANKPFDLRQGPLFRTALIRLGENDHVLLLSLHHIVSDGWSMGVLYRELSALYQAFASEEPSPLPDLPIQYADFAAWQRKWLQGEVLETQLSYWKKQLEGAPVVLNFPTDRPRPARQSYRGARQSIELSAELSQGLKALSRKQGVTLYMTLLAAFQLLLHRYTGQDDIVVGSPIANRTRIEIEELIGFFVNTLVLRTDHSGNPTFRDLLRRVRETALEAYAHQDLPFEKLVEELRPDRDLGRSPLFQAMFVFQNAPARELNCKGLNVSRLRMDGETTKFDLTLSVHEGEFGLRAALQYSTDLFEETTITRFLGHFQILLESIVANPEQRISDLPILSEAERHQVLVEWNESKRDYPKDKSVHQLFEEQVERTPEAVAVVFQEKQLTYRELNTRANQLAHYLKRLGVGPETLVGICVERSLEMIVGLFGILKAGGAYVPLDPRYPQERISFMLDDSRVRILLTQRELAVQLFQNDTLKAGYAPERRNVDADKTVICLDRDWEEIARENEDNPANDVKKGNLAYLIYTSGSTGKPKGVLIQHGSVVNFLASMAREPGLGESDILLAVTTLSFDIAGLEIYLPLTMGARVVLACREIAADSIRLAKLLSESGTTVMQATPTTWRMLLAGGWQGGPELKILCGGEALSEDLAKALGQRCGSVWNMYGPTETTIWSATQRVSANVRRVTLGRPIANTQTYVLDKFLNPVPIGVAGELHIGGDGLARGYLNRPELTAEKFIPNPFSDFSNSRLYRTGDLARYRSDGSIEFLGRGDHQIKLRGYRIELGEIETVLNQHIHVRESIVVTREDAPGDKRLVAYVRADDELNVEELRSWLSAALPDYMIPSAFVRVHSFPLNSNGKIDRTALPPPGQSRPEFGRSYVGPRTEIEATLCEIFGAVLRIDKVGIGIHDNFFELGGHSLLATQAVSRMRDALRKNIPLRSLFETPTISALALSIEKSSGSHEAVPAPPIVRASRDSYRVKIEK